MIKSWQQLAACFSKCAHTTKGVMGANKKTAVKNRQIGITQIVRYRLPLAGFVSICHRLSGAFLFFLLPFILYRFEQSLSSSLHFASFKVFASHWLVKWVIVLSVAAFSFHFLAGIRHLLMDMHWAVTKQGGRNTAAVVFVCSALMTLAVALKLFGIF
jgi:succinate dehydrogenase / fumarate reductase, cytochrome b subunit